MVPEHKVTAPAWVYKVDDAAIQVNPPLDTYATTVKLTVLVVLATTLSASCTSKVTLVAVVVAVGVPVTAPVLALRLKPVGRIPVFSNSGMSLKRIFIE
jgi:hypothetical protein